MRTEAPTPGSMKARDADDLKAGLDALAEIEKGRKPNKIAPPVPEKAKATPPPPPPKPKAFVEPKMALAQKRRALAEAEQNLSKYQGLSGVFRTLTGSGKDHKQKFEEAADKAKADYRDARAEIVGENAAAYVDEMQHLVDAKARAFESKKGIGTKLYEFHKGLGEANLLKCDWYITSRFGQTKVGQMFGRAASVRTAVSMGLLAGGTAFGAGSTAGIVAFAGRRLLSGGSAGVGSYDLMRMAVDRKANTFGADALASMSRDELVERMEKISAGAMLDGKSLEKNAAFQSLKAEFSGRMKKEGTSEADLESDLISLNVKEMMSQTDGRIEAFRAKGARNRRIMKGTAAAVGILAGSGALAKGVMKAKHAVIGEHHEAAKAVVAKPAPRPAVEAPKPQAVIKPTEGPASPDLESLRKSVRASVDRLPKPKAPPAPEVAPPPAPEALPVPKNGPLPIADGKATFTYGEKGEVYGATFEMNPKFQDKMFWPRFRDHFIDVIKEKRHDISILDAQTDILKRMRTLVQNEELLRELDKAGNGAGKEAIYLKSTIGAVKKSIVQDYGDILK